MRVSRFIGLVAAAMLGAAAQTTVQATAQVTAQDTSAPAPVIDYWIGDLAYSGTVQKDASLNLNGGNLNFDLGRSDPVNGTARFKVWLPEDGVPRLQIGECVTALRPAKQGITFQGGGAFVPDYAYTNTSPTCGLQPGEVITKRSDTLTPTADGIRYAYAATNHIEQPYRGKITLSGEALLRPVYKTAPKVVQPSPGSAQMAASEQRAATAPASTFNAAATGSPRTVANADLGARQTMLPTDPLDGLDLFAASGLAEKTIRNFVEGYLGDKIVFMPIRQQTATSFQTRKPVNDYLVPFCAKKNSYCKAPYSTIDGAWVVRTSNLGIRHYVYYHSDEMRTGVYCRLLDNGFDCRPPGPGFVANERMFLTDKNTYGIINSVIPGYDDSPRRFATATPVSASNPHAKCLSYRAVDSYVDTLTEDGRLVKSEHTSTTFDVVNTCNYDIRVAFQGGAAGGCSQTWTGIISDALFGERQNFSLRPNAFHNIGSCRGVITQVEKK